MNFKKTVAFITGTGVSLQIATLLENVEVIKNKVVHYGLGSATVLEHVVGFYKDIRVVVVPRHGPSVGKPDRAPAELVLSRAHEAHIWLFHELGVSEVYAFNAVGALDEGLIFNEGDLFVVPNDYAGGLSSSVHTFGSAAKFLHPIMSLPFSDELRVRMVSAVQTSGARVFDQGLYIYNNPSHLETSAEGRALANLYKDEKNRVVGSTAGPEVILCKEMGIPYAVLCTAVNYVEGAFKDKSFSHDSILTMMSQASEKLVVIAKNILNSLESPL